MSAQSESKSDLFHYAQVLRIFSLIALKLDLPLTVRLLIIYFADMLDCYFLKLIDPTHNCETPYYQINDKIIDLIIYIVIMMYFIMSDFHNALIFVLMGFLLLRTVGVVKFIRSDGLNNRILWQYPDLFREFSLYVALVYDGFVPDNSSIHIAAGLLIIGGKIICEKVLHRPI